MKNQLLILNHSLLFLCTSMYLGTGWSLWLFSFPAAADLTPATYYAQFVPQVQAATQFFTYMTVLMLINGGIMTITEWKQRPYRWFPIIVLLGVVAATALTIWFIIPYNEQMSAGIEDQQTLDEVLGKWIGLNKVRVGLWTMQWGAMMSYFGLRTIKAMG